MKTYRLLLILSIYNIHSYVALAQYDATGAKDTVVINTWNRQAVKYQSALPVKALACADSALHYATIIGYTTGEAVASLHIGSILVSQAEYVDGLNYLYRALEIYKESSNDDGLLNTYNSIAAAYDMEGYDIHALHYAFKAAHLEKYLHNKKEVAVAYNTVATIYCNQNNYARALKYYSKSLRVQERYAIANNTTLLPAPINDNIKRPEIVLDSTLQSIQLHEQDSISAVGKFATTPARHIHMPALRNVFDDGKTAICYGIMLHVQQPVAGTRYHIYNLKDVGHTFITLIKYNTDGTYATQSIGFYPLKDKILRATPFVQGAPPVLQDDSKHAWTESVGKLITEDQFDRILSLIKQYRKWRYNLSSNNCTDFGLKAAFIAGIQVDDTHGRWPGGSGNNPGDAGESILEGRVCNAETGTTFGLFINNTPARLILLHRIGHKLKAAQWKMKQAERNK